MNEIDRPLDRLNYYNGQRLEAADLRAEQRYHIEVRRALNRSLYRAGIAAGLEVTRKIGDNHKVVVSPGLALDIDGRELILLEPREVQVMGNPSTTEGVVDGNYLVLEYIEATTAEASDGCSVSVPAGRGGGGCGCGGAAGGGAGVTAQARSWGGPTRIRADVKIAFRATWPSAADRQIVLAQVELDQGCAVRQIHTYVRRYAALCPAARVRPFALEGEADIDHDNPKKLYFHIRDGAPDTVTLYLRGERFSTLFYTEMGHHGHHIDLVTATDGAHAHGVDVGTLTIAAAGSEHNHDFEARLEDDEGDGIETYPHDAAHAKPMKLNDRLGVTISGGAHHHDVTGMAVHVKTANSAHHHALVGDTGHEGLSIPTRSGFAHRWVEELEVYIDGARYTEEIRLRLGWDALGDGTISHPLVANGTGPLELELLGVKLETGQHTIEFSVPEGCGGRIRWNLYVE